MANLIGFDKNRENLQFKRHSKLSINFMSNYLYVEPENDAFKLISASFKWTYIMKKNLLFVFSEYDFLDFCLAFRNEQVCKKTFDYIASGRKDITISNEEPSINDSFIIPIFQAISNNPMINSDLIETIATWHQYLDEDEKEKYTQMMKEYGISEVISANVEKQNSEIACGRESVQDDRGPTISQTIFSEVVPPSLYQIIESPRQGRRTIKLFTSKKMESYHEYLSGTYLKFQYGKPSHLNKFRCYECGHQAIMVCENGEKNLKIESKNHLCEPIKNDIAEATKICVVKKKKRSNDDEIRKPDYEIFENCPGRQSKFLVIFDPDDRSQCYEYSWTHGSFYCYRCQKNQFCRGNRTKAHIYNEGTDEEYVKVHYANHKCDKKKYEPIKFRQFFQFVVKPDFEIQKYQKKRNDRQKLIIYDQNDKSKCYRYVFATLNKNSEGEEYIILSNIQHACESQAKEEELSPLDFEYIDETKDGIPRIIIFKNNDRKTCFVFSRHQGVIYHCDGCASKLQTDRNANEKCFFGILHKYRESGQYSFQIKPNQTHICEPQPYQPKLFQSTSKTYDFFYFRPSNEPQTVKLAIQCSENQECFTFTYSSYKNAFGCVECQKLKKHIQVKPKKDTDKKEYFNHEFGMHVCQPIKVSTISPPQFIILKEHGLNFQPKIQDESKIIRRTAVILRKCEQNSLALFKSVKVQNFALRKNDFGEPDKKLILRHSSADNLWYELYYASIQQEFVCKKCLAHRHFVTARLQIDDENGESFIVMGKNNHVCQPIQYQSL